MKRILLTALLLAGAFFSAEAKTVATEKPAETKVICTIGLEGEGSFTEVYKNMKECKKYCKGGATVCEETGKKTPVNEEEVD